MLRHKTFKNQDELTDFLKSVTPSDVYSSCAYYADPEADMDRKGWLGADLVFDIDADHIVTPCNKVHDEWTCGNCGFVGVGILPSTCPVCGRQKFSTKSWSCDVCLKSAKEETAELLDMLLQDFGFSESEVHVFFSGHRGYHVHVENEAIKQLDTVARKEIVDYVSGVGIELSFYGFGEKDKRGTNAIKGSNLPELGWHGRLVHGMQNFILDAEEDDLGEIGVKKSAALAILRSKDSLLKGWLDEKATGLAKGVGFESWKKIAEHCVKLQSAQIDTVVTTDVHRLIRLVSTLHSKTGFKKVEFPISDIEMFDPFKSAIAFKKGNATALVSDAPQFRLGNELFGPYKNQKVELPTAAAVLLICRGRAEVIEENVR